MKKIIFAAVVIAVIAGAFFGGTKFGENKGYDKGFNSRSSMGDPYAFLNMRYEIDNLKAVNTDLTSDRDKLLNDYNNLVNQYNSLARTPVYNSINCTTRTIGTQYQTTYTTCY